MFLGCSAEKNCNYGAHQCVELLFMLLSFLNFITAVLKNSWRLLAPPSSLQKQLRLPLTIVFLIFTYQFDFWNEVSDRCER